MSHTTVRPAAKTTKARTQKLRFTRIRFVSSTLSATPDARACVQVVFADGRKRFRAEADGVGGDTVVMRLAVEAAIEALHSATDSAGQLQLIGIKLVPAFDGRVVLVCLNSTLWPEAKLLGAVPVRDSLDEAAARAVLAATNRLIEKPDPPVGNEETSLNRNGTNPNRNGTDPTENGTDPTENGTDPTGI